LGKRKQVVILDKNLNQKRKKSGIKNSIALQLKWTFAWITLSILLRVNHRYSKYRRQHQTFTKAQKY
jgi:aspartyl-tRNA synthetase